MTVLVYWSQLAQMQRDTMLTTAEGSRFREHGRLSGFDHPTAEIPQEDWRGALHEVAFGRRGNFKVVRNALEAALAQFNENLTGGYVTGGTTALRRDAGFENRHVNRLVRTEHGLFFTVGRPNSNVLDLAPVKSKFWDKPVFPATVTNIDMAFLPFLLYERGPGSRYPAWGERSYFGWHCLTEVEFVGAGVTSNRPTYLAEDGDELTPDGIPLGGELAENAEDPGDPEGDGNAPLYLAETGAFPETEKQFNRIIASGCRLIIGAAPLPDPGF